MASNAQMSKSVQDLINKKKEESERNAESTPVPEVLLDMSMVSELKNKITYEELVGEPHPDGKVRYYPAVTEKWDYPEDIPVANTHWIPDHNTLPQTVACIMYGHNGLVVGPPGTGKTTDVREVCARAGIPYYRFSGMEGLEPADLLGQMQLRSGETKWSDGAIMRPVRHGGVWAYDEPFKSPPGTNMAVQWLAEPAKADRSVMLYGHEDENEIKVSAHPQFRMMLCDNARGTGDNMDIYAATNVQDASFINRMQYKVRKDFMDPETEALAITSAYPWVTKKLAQIMVKFAGVMRKAWEHGSIEMPFSFRELETWAEIMSENGGDIKDALESCFGNMLESGDEREVFGRAWKDMGI
jgi:MoxR-like ATPase